MTKNIRRLLQHYDNLSCIAGRGCENACVYKMEIDKILACLTDNEYEVIYWHLIKRETQQVVAKRLGISQFLVSTRVKGVLKKIELLWGKDFFFRS